MYFKRNEPFRFTFGQPIKGILDTTNDEKPLRVNVSVLDVSNYGAKIYCEDKVQLSYGTQIKLSYMIDDTTFDAIGSISWTRHAKTSYEMGLHLNTDDSYRYTMIEALKKWKRMNNN